MHIDIERTQMYWAWDQTAKERCASYDRFPPRVLVMIQKIKQYTERTSVIYN